MNIETKRKRLKPLNSNTNWRIYTFVLNELEKDVHSRGFSSVPNQVNTLLTCYFSGEVLQRPNVDIDKVDLYSTETTQTNWRIRLRSKTLLEQDAAALKYKSISALANNILLRYVLGQRVQRGQ